MKILTLLIVVAFPVCQSQAGDPRRPTEADIVASYESKAIARARQRPDVIRLRFALIKAATDAEKQAISANLYAIMDAAAAQGRQAGLAAVEAQRRSDEVMHQRWDEDRRHDELIWALRNLRR